MTPKSKHHAASDAAVYPPAVARKPSRVDDELARSLERELDAALEATFPASDPIAVDSVAVRNARQTLRNQRRAR